MKIAVVGLGYVGLPLSLQFARKRVHVLGLDVDKQKVDMLNAGKSYIKHIEPAAIAEVLKSESDPVAPFCDELIRMADDFDLDGIQKMMIELDS